MPINRKGSAVTSLNTFSSVLLKRLNESITNAFTINKATMLAKIPDNARLVVIEGDSILTADTNMQ
jgi:UDP-2,3-diacylglucosamine pyrophosphatase LpxH